MSIFIHYIEIPYINYVRPNFSKLRQLKSSNLNNKKKSFVPFIVNKCYKY